jgi:hypothetical protein
MIHSTSSGEISTSSDKNREELRESMPVKLVLIIGVILVLVVFVMAGIMIMTGSKREARDAEIEKHGVAASARILSIVDTGSRYNNNPEVILKLEVRPDKGTPFPAEIRTVISVVDLSGYQPGVMLRVKYDPADTAQVIILGK